MRYRGIALALVALFLASVARFYHPGTGFTALIGFPEGHEYEAPALRAIPHFDYPAWASYDGQFYAQRALDPLLRDPEVDHAMDLPPYRARRILFSWTAFVLGLGRPAWILEAYALQNVACWLLLAVLLTRWIPLDSLSRVSLWAACLFSHGLLWSVRFALLDGPSLLLIACAIAAVESGRPVLAGAVTGISGLARETNLIAALALPVPFGRRGWVRACVALILIALPLVVWEDYLRSIYRSTIFAGADQLVMPGKALVAIWWQVLSSLPRTPYGAAALLCVLAPLAVQAAYIVVTRKYSAPWWRVAAGYAVLMLLLDPVLADPRTGAITRVLLPLTVGFNVLLAGEPRPARFWIWFAAGNLHLIPALQVMPLLP